MARAVVATAEVVAVVLVPAVVVVPAFVPAVVVVPAFVPAVVVVPAFVPAVVATPLFAVVAAGHVAVVAAAVMPCGYRRRHRGRVSFRESAEKHRA